MSPSRNKDENSCKELSRGKQKYTRVNLKIYFVESRGDTNEIDTMHCRRKGNAVLASNWHELLELNHLEEFGMTVQPMEEG